MNSRDAFWRKVRKTSRCWLWTGAMQRGYGVVRINREYLRAHRVSFEWAFGPITDPTAYVLHRCDNRACVRPAHLFLGTQGDNMRDMVRKGRHGWQTCPERMGCKTHPPASVPRGERHVNARLTDAIVREMRVLAATGLPQQAIADHFHVAQTTVSRVLLRQTWAHVP
jgi:hypothetical protein